MVYNLNVFTWNRIQKSNAKLTALTLGLTLHNRTASDRREVN